MKFKYLLTAGILATFLTACGAQQAAEQEDIPVISNDTAVVEEVVAEPLAQDTEIDEEALPEILANMATPQQHTLPEVVLDEAAMADFLELDLNTTDSGLQYFVEEEGTSVVPQEGDVVQVHYVGKLADGTIFDNSYEYERPLTFALGRGIVIPGWDEAVSLLAVGSKAKVIIPSELAYGEMGAGGGLPPNATLYFDVEVLDILPGSPEAPGDVATADYSVTDSGLKYFDFAEGDGPMPEEGQVVSIHYTGWLEDGTKFDSSLDYGIPFVFPVGQDYLVPGWEEGIASMKVGGKRQLVIPAELAFGDEGAGEVIPTDAMLILEVELLDIQS